MKRLILLAALFAIGGGWGCTKTPEAASVVPALPAVVAPVEAQPVVPAAPVAVPVAKASEQVPAQSTKVKKVKPKLDKDVEELAKEYGEFMRARAKCLRYAVDLKIAMDVKAGVISDAGNVLQVSGVCYNGQLRTFDEAVKHLKAKAKHKHKAKH